MLLERSLLLAALVCAAPVPAQTAAARRPNVVLILIDDMGFSDLGCYGGEIDTPNIDALAASGLRFAQFHDEGRCCPTRAALMTGLWPHQTGIGHMTNAPEGTPREDVPPAYQGHLNARCTTLAEVLGRAGYATLMAGKWHLGLHDRADRPLQRGFERFWGLLPGASNHFAPRAPRGITSGDEPVTELLSTTDRRFYTTDAFTDHAIGFVDGALDGGDRPFFLYLAFTAPHWPMQAHEEEIAKYRGRYRIGWDALRARRYRRQVELGLIPEGWALSPRDERVPSWDTLDEGKRDEMDMRMAVYAAMIDRLDQDVGRLVATLKARGVLDDTLILLLSDNGACAEGGVFPKGDIVDAAARNASDGIAYGMAWANASSTPFRLYKHFAHEGGTATPFIAHWPRRIAPRDEWVHAPAQLIDVMPTLLEVAGAEYPAERQGQALPPLEGVSLVPVFDGRPLEREAMMFHEHKGHAFVRDGDWKLVGRNVAPAKGIVPARWELYDLAADGTELHDLAAAEPERVAAMSAAWEAWAERVGVYPKPR